MAVIRCVKNNEQLYKSYMIPSDQFQYLSIIGCPYWGSLGSFFVLISQKNQIFSRISNFDDPNSMSEDQ